MSQRINTFLYASGTVDPASIAAGGTDSVDVTCEGASTTDVAVVSTPSLEDGLIVARVYVSAADTVTVELENHTGSPINGASQTFYVAVFS
jgi:hypothetical protein